MDLDNLIKKELVAMRGGSLTRQMPQLPPNTISLAAGDPDFNQPDFIIDAVYNAMKKGKTHYSYSGDPEFKEAIAKYYVKYGVTVDPKTQVHITSGGSQAIFEAFGTILNPGDEIILLDPAYTGYTEPAAYFGAKVVRVNQGKVNGNFRPDFGAIEKAISDRTKLILYCSPNNPTGTVWTKKEVRNLADIAIKNDLIVLSDEIYTEFIWGDRKHESILNQPEMIDRSMVLMSLSKTFAWTGCRAGYIISGPELMSYLVRVPVGICGVPVPFQKAAVKALSDGWNFVREMRNEYKKRIKYMVPRLNEIEGVTCKYPEGAFYLFPEVEGLDAPVMNLFRDMLMKQQLLLVPGEIYGSNSKKHMRFSLIQPVEVLAEAADRFEKYLKSKP
jgi:aminotransferase